MKRIRGSGCACAFAGVTMCMPATALADEWQHTMLAYIMGAGLDGTTQVGPVTTEIDQSFSEIAEKLDLGLMGTYVAQRDELTLTLDAMYVELSQDQTRPALRSEVELTQTILSFDAGYLVTERLEVLGGLRYNYLDLEAKLTAGSGATTVRGDDTDWVDPYVGLRTTLPFNDAWSLTLRGDIGGFNVGAELAWQAVVRLNWSFSPTLLATFGYRALDADYKEGSGASLFRYDMLQAGPVIGFGWRF